MSSPDFIGIGMERAGSSWIFYMLAHHPEIWVPPVKELHYFDGNLFYWRYGKNLKSRIRAMTAPLLTTAQARPQYFKNNATEYLQWDGRYFTGKSSHDWYASLFDKKFTKGRIAGEITAHYSILTEEKIREIAENFPNTKIILSLRSPVERTVSALLYYFKGQKRKSIDKVSTQAMLNWLDTPLVKELSHTKDIFHRWQKHIAPENLILIDFKDIENTPEDVIEMLYTRLGITPDFRPPGNLARKKIFSFREKEDALPAEVIKKINSICQ